MISYASSSKNNPFTAAVSQWSTLPDSEQRKTLRWLVEQVHKAFSERGLKIPDVTFLEFAVRAGLHNFQMHVVAGMEKDTPENRDRFCTDFVLKLVTPPKAADNYH
jgi:hypothetical protein